ncbi:MAG: GSCFA domain-containing protein [Flavobacteriaceae bacterium]
MIFRTEIPIKQQQPQIDYDGNVVLLGSCFSNNIGEKLNYFKFDTLINPYGIVFNPVAIENAIAESIEGKVYIQNDLIFFNELWLSLHHHTQFSSSKVDEVLTAINNNIELLHNALKNASHVILTLGTAWVYRYLKTDSIVANCHKIPQKEFQKELLTTEQVSTSLRNSIALIKKVNKNAVVIFTVSPVRHLKDGFIENQLSKAHLLSSIHEVITAEKNVHYFPSYEIMMDDLRDYRFYNEDMIHPNHTAIDYIWGKFTETWVSKDAYTVMNDVDTIQKGLAHKPFNPTSKQHQEFLKSIEQKINVLSKKYPSITF